MTEIGPVEIDVPRDTGSTFDPQIVKKRQRRLTGVDEIVLSLSAKGLTTGEIAAHVGEVFGARVSKDTISRITEKVIAEMTEWQNRPLDRVYPVVFIDAIHVKVRDGEITNPPVYARPESAPTANAASSAFGPGTAAKGRSSRRQGRKNSGRLLHRKGAPSLGK